MKNEKLNEKVINYFEMMIDDFCNGNDNEYKVGSKVSFLFEEDEKTDDNNYEEEDINNFINIRKFILNEGGEVKYIGRFGDEDLEYTFKLVNKKKDIKCSFIEPKW
jgi:hypothetical protein